jgi:signal transduction histidine kinase
MRRRITLVAAATAVLAVSLLALPLGSFHSHGYVNDERLELQRAAATAAASLRGDRPTVASLRIDRGEITVGVYDRSGVLLDGAGPARAVPLVTAALGGTEATGTLGADIAVAAPVSDGDQVVAVVLLQAGLSSAHHRSMLAWLVIAGIGLGAVLVSTSGALVVAKRLSAPLEQLRAGARRIGAGDFDARVALSGVAEFDTLAATLNDTAARIQAMIGRERSLSAEVSHQLRTPLSGLRLELEAIAPDRRHDSHVESALAAVDRLDTIITDIIALARDLPGREATHVADLIAAAEQRWRGPLAALTRPLRVVIDPGVQPDIGISARAASQILDVLIDNAHRHGRGAVTVRARPLGGIVAIEVSDEGHALDRPAHELFRARDGSRAGGIGLPFARRLAEAENARLTLSHNDPPTFTLLAVALRSAAECAEVDPAE